MSAIKTDPKLDLVLERIVDVSPALVWKAWTEPTHLMQWFTPVPWSTVACEIDLRPGGLFSTVMRSPEGEDFSNTGCYLEVLPERTLTWTNVLGPNFRPSSAKGSSFDLPFTARVQLEPHGAGTRYIATVLHGSEEICAKHDAMGFHVGWGAALDQLVAHMKGP